MDLGREPKYSNALVVFRAGRKSAPDDAEHLVSGVIDTVSMQRQTQSGVTLRSAVNPIWFRLVALAIRVRIVYLLGY